jgi:hypothetical protein
MKKNLFCFVILLIAIGLFAEGFEFLGIRSGMTKEEVKKVIDYDKLSNEGSYSWIKPKSDFDNNNVIHLIQHGDAKENYIDKNYVNKFTEYPAYEIQFLYTDDNILWKIQIDFERSEYTEKSFTIDSISQLQALESSFPNAEIIVSDIDRNFRSFIYVILIDIDVFNEAVTKKMNEYLIQYKE